MEKPLTHEPQASAPVARRTFLKASGAAAAGLAGILEIRPSAGVGSGQEGPHPALGGLRAGRRRRADPAGGRGGQGPRGGDHAGADQRQRHAGPHHRRHRVRQRADIIQMLHNWTHSTRRHAPTSATAAWKEKDQGVLRALQAGRPRRRQAPGAPYGVVGNAIVYRKDLRRGRGEGAQDVGREPQGGAALKKKGYPFGQTLGHTFGDAPTFSYPYLWSWGGKEVEADGKTVAINTKDTVESVKFLVAMYKSVRRGRPGLGRHEQQPRLPLRDDLGHAERRLDLHRVEAQARPVQDGQGRPDVEAPGPLPAAGGAQASSRTTSRSPTP